MYLYGGMYSHSVSYVIHTYLSVSKYVDSFSVEWICGEPESSRTFLGLGIYLTAGTRTNTVEAMIFPPTAGGRAPPTLALHRLSRSELSRLLVRSAIVS
jgi:hypothetical protein